MIENRFTNTKPIKEVIIPILIILLKIFRRIVSKLKVILSLSIVDLRAIIFSKNDENRKKSLKSVKLKLLEKSPIIKG